MYLLKLINHKLKKRLIYIKKNFIKNKDIRKRYTKLMIYKNNINMVKKLKWGISISVFDGEELLEYSLNNIRQYADYINIIYQKQSWFGKDCNPSLIETLQNLKTKGLVDELIEYKPNLKKSPGHQEVAKRNLGLKYVKKAGCDYFMPMDCDEFYLNNDLEKAKIFIINKDITNAYCKQIIYPKSNLREINDKLCYVTLWTKINQLSRLKRNISNVLLVDPTRQVPRKFNFKPYVFHDINMRHYSFVRKDILQKISNSSNEDLHSMSYEKYLEQANFIEVENYFNINL